MIWIVLLAVTWLAIYWAARWKFPPRDQVELMHMNRVGRRTTIVIGVVVLFALVWWVR